MRREINLLLLHCGQRCSFLSKQKPSFKEVLVSTGEHGAAQSKHFEFSMQHIGEFC